MILFPGDSPATRRQTAPDMRVEARAMALGDLVHIQRALADGEGGMDEPQHLRRRDPHHIGTEIASVVALQATNHLHPREVLRRIDSEEGIEFVVFQEDIVERFVQFDQIILEDERLLLGMGDQVVEIGDLRDHLEHLLRLGRTIEIGAHAVFEILRLADVDDPPALVSHHIHPAVRGEFL